jgi:hypothetical protein
MPPVSADAALTAMFVPAALAALSRRQNDGRQAQAAEHEPDGAPEHACPERRRGR